MAMLAMVMRASTESESTTGPENSRARYRAPETPRIPMTSRMRSLPPTNSGSSPVISTLMEGGTLNQVSPMAMAPAMSVEPMPVAKAPRPP